MSLTGDTDGYLDTIYVICMALLEQGGWTLSHDSEHSWCDPLLVLQVMTDVEDKNEWKNCIDIAGVQLPTGYFFGASAGTGDLSGERGFVQGNTGVEPGFGDPVLAGELDFQRSLPTLKKL